MSTAIFPLRTISEFTPSDGSRGAAYRQRPPARVLGCTAIGQELRLSHVRAQTREWLVIHGADCTPQVLADNPPDDPNTRSLPIVVYAPTSEERDRLLQELPGHVAATLRGRAVPESHVIEVQELRIDKDAYRVTVDSDDIRVPHLQFKLLVALVEGRDRVQSRRVLLREVWGIPGETTSRTVDTNVKRLRDRLRSAGRFIQSIRGVGYRFSETPRLSNARVE